jgi:hypothetical protein
MNATQVFAHVVLVFILTTVIFIFLDNKGNIEIPTLNNEIKKESKHKFIISLGLSLFIVIILMLLKLLKN